MKNNRLRLGVDLGGTKVEGIVLAPDGEVTERLRIPTPQGDYDGTLKAIHELVQSLKDATGQKEMSIGICTPGSISPTSGKLRNANSTCLNGRHFKSDLENLLQCEIRMANDADCLAVSEATDGAGAGATNVFAVILGTGVGGGLIVNGHLVGGQNAISGEWGHNPLPWMRPEWQEYPGRQCWCGQYGCIETWLSGPGMVADWPDGMSVEELLALESENDAGARSALARYEDRLARALAHVINIFDPEVIVLGGGVSNVQRLYRHVPALWDQWVFSDEVTTRLEPAVHGDSSGVRGAAWLWQ